MEVVDDPKQRRDALARVVDLEWRLRGNVIHIDDVIETRDLIKALGNASFASFIHVNLATESGAGRKLALAMLRAWCDHHVEAVGGRVIR